MAVAAPRGAGAEVAGLDVHVYTVPIEEPESDGTLAWDSTTARRRAAGRRHPLRRHHGDAAGGRTLPRAQRAVSAHCAPAVSAHACCAMETLRHLEYFHDHVRVEALLFEGVLEPERGLLRPDRSRPGLGIELKRHDATRYSDRG